MIASFQFLIKGRHIIRRYTTSAVEKVSWNNYQSFEFRPEDCSSSWQALSYFRQFLQLIQHR